MKKSSLLLKERDEIAKLAEQSGIGSLLFHKPFYTEWDEEDDCVYCMVSTYQQPDPLKIDAFSQAVEKKLGFKLILSMLNTTKSHMQYDSRNPKDKKEYQREINIINAAIPLEKITEEPLLDQLDREIYRVEAKAALQACDLLMEKKHVFTEGKKSSTSHGSNHEKIPDPKIIQDEMQRAVDTVDKKENPSKRHKTPYASFLKNPTSSYLYNKNSLPPQVQNTLKMLSQTCEDFPEYTTLIKQVLSEKEAAYQQKQLKSW